MTTPESVHVTMILNKPIGYVSGQAEDGCEPAVMLGALPEGRWRLLGSEEKFA